MLMTRSHLALKIKWNGRFKKRMRGILPALFSVLNKPKPVQDELIIAAYANYLSLISGLVFFCASRFDVRLDNNCSGSIACR